MITIKQVKQIARDLNITGYKYIGIRVQDQPETVGAILGHCSNVWIDGEMSAKKLPGVCAVKAGKYQINPIDGFSGYDGETIIILGSNKAKRGADEGEIIMVEPVVLEVR